MVDLVESQLLWLRKVADAPEGIAQPGTHNTLLSLEFHDLVTSRAEPNRRNIDRWTITQKGRDALK